MPYAKRRPCQTCGAPCAKRFCSKPCYGKSLAAKRPRTFALCEHCGMTYRVRPYLAARGMGRWCSVACANQSRRRPFAERFAAWRPVGHPTACWLWTGARDRDGYGVIDAPDYARQLRAHRVAYELAHGRIPAGKQVMHTCDNPTCCNPNHLRVGSADENNKDKAQKLRASAKLTADDVREIRRRLAAGHTLAEIAERFGVTGVNVWHIKHRHSWRHLTD